MGARCNPSAPRVACWRSRSRTGELRQGDLALPTVQAVRYKICLPLVIIFLLPFLGRPDLIARTVRISFPPPPSLNLAGFSGRCVSFGGFSVRRTAATITQVDSTRPTIMTMITNYFTFKIGVAGINLRGGKEQIREKHPINGAHARHSVRRRKTYNRQTLDRDFCRCRCTCLCVAWEGKEKSRSLPNMMIVNETRPRKKSS